MSLYYLVSRNHEIFVSQSAFFFPEKLNTLGLIFIVVYAILCKLYINMFMRTNHSYWWLFFISGLKYLLQIVDKIKYLHKYLYD